MQTEFQKYLEDIGATQPVIDRVEYIYNLCRNIAFQKLLDIFIDDYLAEDKSRKYTGLSFYSKDFVFSVPNFLTESKIVILPHRAAQDRISISVANYDFKKTNKDSALSVQLYEGHVNTGALRASQNNCAYLVKILRKYVQPSLARLKVLAT